MARYKTYDSTGVAPAGRLYAGDLNAIQDMKLDSSDFSQVLDLATLRIGEPGLQLSRFGSSEARISGALRVDGILRGGAGAGLTGGVLPASMTTAQRDALPPGFRPKGLQIFNTTTNQPEFNAGTDGVPNWQAYVVGAAPSGAAGGDLSGSFPNPQIAGGVIVNADISPSAAIAASKISGYPSSGAVFLAGDGTWKPAAAASAPSGPAGGALGGTYPNPTLAAGAVNDAAVIAGAGIAGSKLALNNFITQAHLAPGNKTTYTPDISAGPPGSPSTGDIWIAGAGAAGEIWVFRYNGSSGSPYKWEFIGGSPVIITDLTVGAAIPSDNAWHHDNGLGNMTIWRSGDYLYEYTATVNLSADGESFVGIGVGLGGAQPTFFIAISKMPSGGTLTLNGRHKDIARPANQLIDPYIISSRMGGVVSIDLSNLSMVPYRVI